MKVKEDIQLLVNVRYKAGCETLSPTVLKSYVERELFRDLREYIKNYESASCAFEVGHCVGYEVKISSVKKLPKLNKKRITEAVLRKSLDEVS